MVHALERDQGQPPVHAQLGDVLVLHAVRPAPQHLALAHVRKVIRQRLGQQDDITVRQQLPAAAHTSDMARQLLVRHAETFTVTVLQIDALPHAGIHMLQMQRVDRKPPLILLLRPREHPETEQFHAHSPDRVLYATTTRKPLRGPSHGRATGNNLARQPIARLE